MAAYDIVSSIVLYQNDRDVLRKAMDSFLHTSLRVKLYLLDNSPDQSLADLPQGDSRVVYIFNGGNLGFGKAHNIALRLSMSEAKYHLVLNPDVRFGAGVLEKLVDFMETNPDAGQVMPKILYPDGRVQHLCKLLPSPLDLIFRRFFPWVPGVQQRNRRYELIDTGYNKVMNIPFLSGCLMLFRVTALRDIGFFDDRFFMYTEDVDLTRRMHQRYMTLFYPDVEVYHDYARGSYKSLRLTLYNIRSAMIYFSKWGWIFDRERRQINRRVLEKYTPAR